MYVYSFTYAGSWRQRPCWADGSRVDTSSCETPCRRHSSTEHQLRRTCCCRNQRQARTKEAPFLTIAFPSAALSVILASFEKSFRLISLIWSPLALLPFVYSIVTIRSIWICVHLLHRDYSEHDLNARSPDFERSDHSVVHIKDGGRKWLCFTCRWKNNVFHRQVRKYKI